MMAEAMSRPARWSGRTPSPVAALGPELEIAIEALVETTVAGPLHGRTAVHRAANSSTSRPCVTGGCSRSPRSRRGCSCRSGVARVLVADMAADGLVAVYEPTSLDGNDAVGTELLERVLSGLRRL